MPAAARQHAASEPFAIDDDLIEALNEAAVALITSVPPPVVSQGVRKFAYPPTSEPEMMRLIKLAAALTCVLNVFAPSLSGTRPVDRHARAAAAAKGGDAARAFASLANSKFRLFHVEGFGARGLATARDCVTGATFQLASDSLDPIVLEFDIGTRLCPLGAGIFWPMGPFVPLGPHGEGRASRFPSRPGKGLVNDAAVAQQLYREYVRAGAPFGLDFGLRLTPAVVTLSFGDGDLNDYAEAVRERDEGPEPSGALLSRLRNLASPLRLAMAMNCSIELEDGGIRDGAAIYRVAARILLEVLAERIRIGTTFAAKFDDLGEAVTAAFGAKGMPAKVAALFEALKREVRPPAKEKAPGDDELARVIARIRALRGKTVEQGCTEQEALIAAGKVAELLERYGLTLSEVELRKQNCEGFGFDTGRKQAAPIDNCFRWVATFCDCHIWNETGLSGELRHVLFGLPADIEAARCLKDLVIAAFDTETESFKRGEVYRNAAGPKRRAMVKSFQIGLSLGVSRKLRDLKAAREKAASNSTGRDLMIVKRSIVEEELEKLGMSFRTQHRRAKRVIAEAYNQGMAASHRFEVNEKIG